MRAHLIATLAVAALATLAACKKEEPQQPQGAAPPAARKLKIGLSMDTLKEERWQRDRDFFVKQAEALGAQVLVQAANGDDALQISQSENMLTQGVDVLVVIPHNGKAAATIVQAAHKAGVPVLAYDRLILDAEVDLYISFDNLRVGELQAEYIVKRAPKGAYVLIGGAPTDNNALLYHQGHMSVLKPLVDKGDIRIVSDQYARDWLAVEGLKIMENALTQSNNKVDAVVAANDGLASAAIQALSEQKLAGKVPVSGQDAELAALQRIVAGTQSMTVYKPVQRLADRAAQLAVKLARKEPHGEAVKKIHNGLKDIDSVLLDPVVVDKDNLLSTVVADGYHKLEDVYKDVPREQWPQQAKAQ